MHQLQTVRLKPNPTGKDKSKSGQARQAQLGAEWVDVKNVGHTSAPMHGVRLYHIAYPSDKAKPAYWELVVAFAQWELGAGEAVRIHSGARRELSLLDAEDREGVQWHTFTGHDKYIWNNAEGDASRVTQMDGGREQESDRADYDPNPPEGVVLIRAGNKLIPTGVSAYTAAFGSR